MVNDIKSKNEKYSKSIHGLTSRLSKVDDQVLRYVTIKKKDLNNFQLSLVLCNQGNLINDGLGTRNWTFRYPKSTKNRFKALFQFPLTTLFNYI